MVYRIRLQDPNSAHYRETLIAAASEEDARAKVAEREGRMVSFRLPDEVLTEVEAKEQDPDTDLTGKERGALHTHRQTAPYEVVSVEERS